MPLLIIAFLSSFLFAQETSVARYARSEHGMLKKEYDFEGGRAYWIDGISVLGVPDFSAGVTGFDEPARRLPFGFAGIYVADFYYERYGLSLNGTNGNLKERKQYNPLDTPVTSLLWEIYGLEGNALRLDFGRLLLDSIGFEVGVSAHSTSPSDEFRYQDIVNQLFVNTLKRDSSRVPLMGRNLEYSSIHIAPVISWYLPHSTISLKASLLTLENDDATRMIVEREAPYTDITFPAPYRLDMSSFFYGLAWEFRPVRSVVFNAEHRVVSQEFKFKGLDTASVYFGDSIVEQSFSGHSGEGQLMHKTALNPHIRWSYEFLENRDSSLWQNRELFAFGVSDSLWRISISGETALQRNFSVEGERSVKPAFYARAGLAMPFHLHLMAAHQEDWRFPDMLETHIARPGRIAFPNESLKPEKKERSDMSLSYKLNRFFFYEVGYRYEQAYDLIVPVWAAQKNRLAASLPADTAFKWTNLSSVYNNELFWNLGFALGNWEFFAEQGKTILRSNVGFVPSRYYKGGAFWSNKFVEDRLKVSVQFDADWFGSRYDYGLLNDSVAVPVKLRNYLSLNFKSKMQIQSFILYAKIENMNHSLMEPEVGYIPPGIRFSYGIQWRLDD